MKSSASYGLMRSSVSRLSASRVATNAQARRRTACLVALGQSFQSNSSGFYASRRELSTSLLTSPEVLGTRTRSVAPRLSNGSMMMQNKNIGAIRSLFIKTEETPNPSSLKFIPGQEVLPAEFGASMDFRKGDPTDNSPLVRLILRIDGVTGVFLGNDFITVSKEESLHWNQLKAEIFGTIMDFYASDKPAVTGEMQNEQQDASDEDDSEIVILIKELLEERIRPMVHEDGGDIFFKGFDEDTGIVKVQLAGSCSGCPSSTLTLKSGVENLLMHYLPEVTAVEAVGDMDLEMDHNARTLQFHPQD